MERFKSAHAAAATWHEALDRCLAALDPLPPGANLGFVYLTDPLATAAADIVAALEARTGIARWVGTSGMGICGGDREYFGEPALALLVATFADESFTLFELRSSDLDRFRRDLGAWLDRSPLHFGIVHGDPRNAATVELLPELAAAADAFLVGGLTSSTEAFPQIARGITDGGLSGVLFSGDVAVATGLTQGCSPLGPVHEVTRCQDNILVSLDGRPALEVFKEDIGELLARDLRRVAGYIFAALPIEGSDHADYVVRNLMGFDAGQGLVAIGDLVQEGQRLMFCRRDRQAAQKDLDRMLADLARRAGSAPRAAVYCSCVARGPNMFGPESAELGAIARALGDIPLVGFFGNGEFSHDRLYTYTGVLTLFL